jgi:hypothetical protein
VGRKNGVDGGKENVYTSQTAIVVISDIIPAGSSQTATVPEDSPAGANGGGRRPLKMEAD